MIYFKRNQLCSHCMKLTSFMRSFIVHDRIIVTCFHANQYHDAVSISYHFIRSILLLHTPRLLKDSVMQVQAQICQLNYNSSVMITIYCCAEFLYAKIARILYHSMERTLSIGWWTIPSLFGQSILQWRAIAMTKMSFLKNHDTHIMVLHTLPPPVHPFSMYTWR